MKAEDRDSVISFLASCRALDGIEHSRHLLSQADDLLRGLDAWRLSAGSAAITIPAGIGKSVVEPEPDRELFRAVLSKLASSPPGGASPAE